MNREIEFRIYHSDWNRMFYSQPCESQPKREWCPFEFPIGFSYYDSSKFSSLMQFTGLRDKNGKDIYEGDFIYNIDEQLVYKVEWDSKLLSFTVVTIQDSSWVYLSNVINDLNCFEIIGNIYENPELIK